MAAIDLHVHSHCSDDGDFAPEELVAMAVRAGVEIMAVADHNTTAAVDGASGAGKALGVEIIPAVELDCHHGGLRLHILGYGVDAGDVRYRRIHESVTAREREASARRMELVEKLGFAIDRRRLASLSANGVATGEMIAEVLLSDPSQRGHPLLRPFLPGGKRSENPFANFYWDICAPGKPAHVAMEFMNLVEAVRLIEDTGGVAVVAHPGMNLAGREEALADLAVEGVKGVEAFSSYHSPEECRKWRELAENHGMLATCGSDFHGRTKPSVKLGRHGWDGDGDLIMERLRLSMHGHS